MLSTDPSAPSLVAGQRLAALILLGGRVRPTELGKLLGRHRLDLPLDEHRSLLGYWLEQAAGLSHAWGTDHLPVRVLLDQSSPAPALLGPTAGAVLSLERDLSEFRGTGGVLHDVCRGYAEDDLVLVVNAAQMLLRPLAELAGELAATGGNLALASHDDGTPSGLILLRCKALRVIPDVGFHDMKEQAIPAIAKQYRVQALHYRHPTCCPIRTRTDYLAALRHYHHTRHGGPLREDPFAEQWQPSFVLLEKGATAEPSAYLHDSVILRGAQIARGAVVVRSVVAEGTRVLPGQVFVDQLVGTPPER